MLLCLTYAKLPNSTFDFGEFTKWLHSLSYAVSMAAAMPNDHKSHDEHDSDV